MALSLITDNNVLSYNRAVMAINQNQKRNAAILEATLSDKESYIASMNAQLSYLNTAINNVKWQIFVNQALIDNQSKNSNYTYPVTLLQ